MKPFLVLPCPYCGAKAGKVNELGFRNMWHADGCFMPMEGVDGTVFYGTGDEKRAAWNRRAKREGRRE